MIHTCSNSWEKTELLWRMLKFRFKKCMNNGYFYVCNQNVQTAIKRWGWRGIKLIWSNRTLFLIIECNVEWIININVFTTYFIYFLLNHNWFIMLGLCHFRSHLDMHTNIILTCFLERSNCRKRRRKWVFPLHSLIQKVIAQLHQ